MPIVPESPEISFLYNLRKVLAKDLFSNGIKAKTTMLSLCLLCLIMNAINSYFKAPFDHCLRYQLSRFFFNTIFISLRKLFASGQDLS